MVKLRVSICPRLWVLSLAQHQNKQKDTIKPTGEESTTQKASWDPGPGKAFLRRLSAVSQALPLAGLQTLGVSIRPSDSAATPARCFSSITGLLTPHSALAYSDFESLEQSHS